MGIKVVELPYENQFSSQILNAMSKSLKLKELFEGKKTLEIGAGDGRFSRVVGIHSILMDLDKEKLKSSGFKNTIIGNIRKIPLKDKSIGRVISWLVLDLFIKKEVEKIIKESYRVLEKGGIFLFGGDYFASLSSNYIDIMELSKIGFTSIPAVFYLEEEKINLKIVNDVGMVMVKLNSFLEVVKRVKDYYDDKEFAEYMKLLIVLNDMISKGNNHINSLNSIYSKLIESDISNRLIQEVQDREKSEVIKFTANFISQITAICREVFNEEILGIESFPILIDEKKGEVYASPFYIYAYKK